MKNLQIFWLLSKASIKTYLSSPVGIVFFTLGKILRFVLFLVLIIFIVSGSKMIKGYSPNQAIIFYLSFNLIDTASQLIFREVYRFRSLIVNGEFDFVLLKPHHPFVKILFGGIDFFDLIMLCFYIPLTIFYISDSGYFVFPFFIFYVILLVNGMIIAAAIHILVLSFAILTTEVDHTMMIFRDITSTARFPLEIYGKNIRFFLTFIIPVAIMMSYPAKALFNLLSVFNYFISFLLSTGFLFLSIKFWQQALKKYQSWGG